MIKGNIGGSYRLAHHGIILSLDAPVGSLTAYLEVEVSRELIISAHNELLDFIPTKSLLLLYLRSVTLAHVDSQTLVCLSVTCIRVVTCHVLKHQTKEYVQVERQQ